MRGGEQTYLPQERKADLLRDPPSLDWPLTASVRDPFDRTYHSQILRNCGFRNSRT